MPRTYSLKRMLQIQRLPFKNRIEEANDLLASCYRASGDIHRREYVMAGYCQGHVSNTVTKDTPRKVVMFGSNDYLGLSQHPEVKRAAVLATQQFGTSFSGSPVMNGLSPLHTELERKLAALKGTKAAVLLQSGFVANLAWVRTLIGERDVVVADQYSHNSFREAVRSMPSDRRRTFAHNSASDLRKHLAKAQQDRAASIFVFLEGLYSMHGDIALLPDILEVCDEYGALPIIDDAHGTGTLGPTGRGVFEHFAITNVPFIIIGTLSKALGAVGGFIACQEDVEMAIRSTASPYIFSASLPPATVAAGSAAVDVMLKSPERLAKLRRNIRHAVSQLQSLGFPADWQSPIFPITVPHSCDVGELVTEISEAGCFVNGVSFPAVPLQDQRVRVSICSEHSPDQIDALVSTLNRLLPVSNSDVDGTRDLIDGLVGVRE